MHDIGSSLESSEEGEGDREHWILGCGSCSYRVGREGLEIGEHLSKDEEGSEQKV